MSEKYNPEPVRYDQVRVRQLEPIRQAILSLRLPPRRYRKLHAILNALEVQIEDGGDNPEVNDCLLEALRLNICHQVNEQQGQTALLAIDAFAQGEARRWSQLQAGTLLPIDLTLQEQLDDLIQDGYMLLTRRRQIAAVDKWLAAWKLVKQMATPAMRTTEAFDVIYSGMLQSIYNWCGDLEMELHNAGVDDANYLTHCIRYVDEFLTQFPDENANHCVNMLRAKGESLWELDRQTEAETVYQTLVTRYPDEGWGYIGWADQYYLYPSRPPEYERAEELLLKALALPALNDRCDVLERLVDLYKQWGQPEKQAQYAKDLETLSRQHPERSGPVPTLPLASAQVLRSSLPESVIAIQRLRRNDPCWCGSGKKYKHCHMRSDHTGKR